MKYDKILNIATIILFVVTMGILGLFMFGGEIPDQIYYTPIYTAAILNWAYVLFAITIFSAVLFPIIRLFTRPKDAMKSFIGIAFLAVMILIAYALSDGTPLSIIGYTGSDNVPEKLIMTDTLIYTIYLLFGVLVVAIIGTEIYKKVK